MAEPLYHRTTPEEHRRRVELAPAIHDGAYAHSTLAIAAMADAEK